MADSLPARSWSSGLAARHSSGTAGVTDGVAQTNDAYDLSPVQHPNTPVVDPSALTRPACLRDICVYRPDELPLPQVLVADVRLFGPLLGTWICRAFGLQDSEWSCRRLAEALPSFPSEQYVLTPRHHPWHRSYIPVDLRPLGGPVVLCDAIRAQPCGDIALQALAGRSTPLTGGLVCRCSQGWFLPSAYLSLLPYGDAFQVWPAQHINVELQPVAQDSLPRPPTLEDRFASSIDRTSVAEVAFHEASGSNAVILSNNGLVYAEVPTFADYRVIRTAALQAYASHDPDALGALHFARIMPPLDGLPAIQFAAVHCAGTDEPSVVDMRAVGGNLVALSVPANALPFHRITAAIREAGDPDPRHPLHSRIQMGQILVLNRERPIDAFSQLTGAFPRALVLVPRRPVPAVATEIEAASDSHCPSDSTSAAWRPSRYLILLLCGMGTVRAQLSSMACYLALFASGGLSMTVDHTPHPKSWRPVTTVPCTLSTDTAPVASVVDHSRLAAFWNLGEPDEVVWQRVGSGGLDDTSLVFRLEAFVPGEQWTCSLRHTETFADLRGLLSQLALVPGRCEAVLVQPQATRRSVQFVAPTQDPQTRTILVDLGTAVLCLDVPKVNAGTAVLAALAEYYPQRTFRLDVASRLSLRHGDVVFGFEDVPITFEVGPIAWPHRVCQPAAANGMLGPSQTDIIVSAADFDLLSLRIPPGISVRECSSAMCSWLGRQRCHGVLLQPLGIHAYSQPVFCLPRRGRNSLVVTLRDAGNPEPFILHTLDVEAHRVPSFSDMCQCPRPRYGGFWRDVSMRQPECIGLDTYQVSHDPFGTVIAHIQLVVDLARARLFGWRATTAMRPRLWDLAQNGQAPIGIHWDIVAEADRAEAATQTFPAHRFQRADRPLTVRLMNGFIRPAPCSTLIAPRWVFTAPSRVLQGKLFGLSASEIVYVDCVLMLLAGTLLPRLLILALGICQEPLCTVVTKSGSGLMTLLRWPVTADTSSRGHLSPRAAM